MPRRFGISAREAKPRQLARHGSLHLHFPHLVRLVLGIHEHGLCARLVLAPQVASLALLEKSQVPDLRRIRDLVVVLLGLVDLVITPIKDLDPAEYITLLY